MSRLGRILIIKPSSLGDVVHGLQVAAVLRRHIPEIVIDWVVRDCFTEVVAASGLVDEIFEFHRGRGLVEFIRLIAAIRKRRYDYVLDMQGLARSAVMAFFSKAGVKIGRSDAREFSWLAYGKKIPLPRKNFPHAIDILLQFLPEFGVDPRLDAGLNFSTKPSVGVSELFHGDGGQKPSILLFPESRRREKEWPYFAQLTVALANKFTKFQVIISAKNSFNVGESFVNVKNLSGRTSIGDVIFLIQRGRLVIANDSAPVHLAAAIGIPVLALFGPTDPGKFGPYPSGGKNNFVLRAVDGDMSSLAVDAVLDKIVQILSPKM
ncbi:MAG: glycosyltransferase family 9 protein [Puniceicoccales bacterium]|jgi:ADP-heptose:LPS heptosyltransferase|nr:glycosyltransferase family 9 protein [Puniceicoccales bacterium]